MSVGTSISISGDLQAALAGLKPEAMVQAIRRGMDRGLHAVSARLIEDRLTGKGPFPVAAHKLGVKTGRLRQSVRTAPARISGLEVVASIGSRVRYAGAHEFGFSGTVQVDAHQRTIKKRGGRTIRKADRPVIAVKAHQRAVNIPERAPFRTAIAEHMGLIESAISREVSNTMKL